MQHMQLFVRSGQFGRDVWLTRPETSLQASAGLPEADQSAATGSSLAKYREHVQSMCRAWFKDSRPERKVHCFD